MTTDQPKNTVDSDSTDEQTTKRPYVKPEVELDEELDTYALGTGPVAGACS